MRGHARARRRTIACAVGLVVLACPASAAAHPHLADLKPAPEAVLAQAPGAVQLIFSEPVDDLGNADAVKVNGRQVPIDVLERGGGSLVLLRPQTPFPAGRVDVSFRVLGSDGHVLKGRYGFRVKNAQLHAAVAPARSERLQLDHATGSALPTARVAHGLHHLLWIVVAGALLAGPLVALGGAVWPGGALRLACAGAAVLSVAGASLTWLSGRDGSAIDVFSPHAVAEAAGTSSGAGWLVRAGLWTAAAVAVGRAPRRDGVRGWVLGGLLIAIAVSLALGGHADANGPAAAVAVDALHLLAAGAWLGGLVLLAWTSWRGRGDAGARGAATGAYGRVAMIAFPVLLATGIANAVFRVGSVDAAVDERYGQLVLAKVALAAGIVIAAAVGVRAVRDHGDGEVAAPPTRLAAELVLGGAALVIATVLIQMDPPS